MYKSPGRFKTTEDSSLVYNLQPAGFSKGEEVFCNDFSIQIHQYCPGSKPFGFDDNRIEVAEIICAALNRAFPPPIEEDRSDGSENESD
jgi:hypothetical protein